MKIARVILTGRCDKDCDYCCNRQKDLLKDAPYLTNPIAQLRGFTQVCITGGEPQLEPFRLMKFLADLHDADPMRPMYLYTATYSKCIQGVLLYLSGVTYTLHNHATEKDIDNFIKFQNEIRLHPNKTYRLSIHMSLNESVPIVPRLWSRITTFIPSNECTLPPNETLFIFKG